MIGCILQARMGSTRLPKKVLMHLNSIETVLSFGIKQIQNCTMIDKLVVATTDLAEDDEITDYISKLNVECFRGSATDVLDRYYSCAKKFAFSTIVRITSDCPLIDPTIIDKVVSEFLKNKDHIDYISNVHPRTFPHGMDVEVFSFTSLENAWFNAKKHTEREHVTPYFYTNNRFKMDNISNPINLSHLRCTLDYKQDLDLIKEIISQIQKRPILMDDILNLFSSKPQLSKINENIPQDGGTEKSLKKDVGLLN